MPEIVIRSREALISPHMKVQRILPFRDKRMVGPFIFMDHGGPVHEIPGNIHAMDVLPHPHIGLSTVSYLFDGKVTHRDSLGVQQIILPGEVNWMTAGSGIAHSERFEDPASLAGGLEMIQSWVALPEEFEEVNPSFDNYKPHQLPVFTDKGIWWRLIAGNAFGEKSAVKTHSPLFYLHVQLDAGSKFSLPTGYTERGIYIVNGRVEISNVKYEAGHLIVFKQEEQPVINAPVSATLMVFGGEPVGPRHIWWNFVSSRKERIEQAKEDWREGRIMLPPSDDKEFIPLPEDHRKKDAPPAPDILS
jgi:redox-sensitive bicupin YhaK (pirin superfamily)